MALEYVNYGLKSLRLSLHNLKKRITYSNVSHHLCSYNLPENEGINSDRATITTLFQIWTCYTSLFKVWVKLHWSEGCEALLSELFNNSYKYHPQPQNSCTTNIHWETLESPTKSSVITTPLSKPHSSHITVTSNGRVQSSY